MKRESAGSFLSVEKYKKKVYDDSAFEKIALFPFYSNRKAKTVDCYAPRILYWLGDYKKLARLTTKKAVNGAVKQMMDDSDMYHFEKKFRGAIDNAARFQSMIKEHGSFVDYVFSFQPMTVTKTSINSSLI